MQPLAILLCLVTAAAAATTDDIIPKGFSKGRYAETVKKSPFILETKAVEVEKPGPDWPNNLYLRGVGKADGKDYVLLQRLGEERSMRFFGSEPGPDGLAVKTVRLGNSFRETKVVMEKGTDTREIGFKEDTINAPHPVAGVRGPPLAGGLPKPGSVMPPQMQMPTRVLPPNPVQPGPPPAGAVPPSLSSPQAPGGSQRTRIRSIRN